MIAAAVFGALSLRLGTGRGEFDVAAAVTVLALVGALVLEIWLLTERPDKTWYDGRALAESAKTIGWRYAVGGAPFPVNVNEPAAEGAVTEQLKKLLRDVPDAKIDPSVAPAISQAMRSLRGKNITDRKQSYLRARIIDQQQWYTSKARWNQKRAIYWRIGMLGAEVVGISVALVRTLGFIDVDLVGIVAAVVATGAAWLAVKQHDSLSRAYAFAANELGIVRTRLESIEDEDVWAKEVGDAEEAISREHTMWRASRSTLK